MELSKNVLIATTVTTATVVIFSIFPIKASAQDHPAAPMIGELAVEEPSQNAHLDVNRIKADFSHAYVGAGRPRLAIFWNRKLDDQLSQWYTGSRRIDTRGGWWGGKGFTATQQRIDIEDRFDGRPQPSEVDAFDFGAGFTRTLLNSGVDIVDRDMIMRLTHSDAKEAADTIIVADYQQVEIDALIGYADLFAEVLFAPAQSGDENINFLINIKEVNSGRVVTMFRSDSNLEEAAYKYEWVGTAQGYRKIKVPDESAINAYDADGIRGGSPEHVGWNVAVQTMEALTRYWRA